MRKARQQRGLFKQKFEKKQMFNCGTTPKGEGIQYNLVKTLCDSLHNSTENHICRDCSNRSSYKERKGNALASGAEEGRDKLR